MEAGGRTFFGCTYKQYLNVENGQSAPGPETLEKIATALHVWFNDSQAREFFIAYLRTVLRSRELLEMALRALAVPPGGPTPLRQAIQKDFQNRRFRVTPAQAAMYSSYAHYWISNVFCNDNGEWSAEACPALGLEPPAVRKVPHSLDLVSSTREFRPLPLPAPRAKSSSCPKDPLSDPQVLRGREMLEKMASRTGVRRCSTAIPARLLSRPRSITPSWPRPWSAATSTLHRTKARTRRCSWSSGSGVCSF